MSTNNLRLSLIIAGALVVTYPTQEVVSAELTSMKQRLYGYIRACLPLPLSGASACAFSTAMALKLGYPASPSLIPKLLLGAGAIGIMTSFCMRFRSEPLIYRTTLTGNVIRSLKLEDPAISPEDDQPVQRATSNPQTVQDWFERYSPLPHDASTATINGHFQQTPRLTPAFVRNTWQRAYFVQNGKIVQELGSKAGRTITLDDATYARKLLIPADATITYLGDLHGNISAASCIFNYWYTQNKIDANFHILDPKAYYVFGGDFVDRGNFGIEVTTLIAYFFIQNPEQVILLRGNHEELNTNQIDLLDRLPVASACKQTTPSPNPKNFSTQLRQFDPQLRSTFATFIHTMPSALYIGDQAISPESRTFIKCCHGGCEMRRDLTKYLRSSELFYLITYPSLRDPAPCPQTIARILQAMEEPEQVIQKDSDPREKRANYHDTIQIFYQGEVLYSATKNCMSPPGLGDRWSDVATPTDQHAGTSSKCDLQRSMRYGSSLMKTLPEISNNLIISYFRAHQHSESMKPLINPLNGGLYVLYKNPGYGRRPDADFPVPIVTTVASSEAQQLPCYIEYRWSTQELTHHFMPYYQLDNARSPWQTRTGLLRSWRNRYENFKFPQASHVPLPFDESYRMM